MTNNNQTIGMNLNDNFNERYINYELIEALCFSKKISFNPHFKLYHSNFLAVTYFIANKEHIIPAKEHSHEAYEFLMPLTPFPYLCYEDYIYFGEVGYLYPIQSNKQHGLKYQINNVSFKSIAIDKDFFENILISKGFKDYVFNEYIPCSEHFYYLLTMFEHEVKKYPIDFEYKVKPLCELICSEIIDSAVNNKGKAKKVKQTYKKGIKAAVDYINEHYLENFLIEKLAEISGFSINYFNACFKECVGLTPKSYINRLRLTKAKALLEFSHLYVQEISKICGFNKFNSFTSAFKNYTGLTPTEYRNTIISSD